jgi:hypothetical protein
MIRRKKEEVSQSLVYFNTLKNIGTTCFNNQNLYIFPNVLCASCGSDNKRLLFPTTELADWYLCFRHVSFEVGVEFLNMNEIKQSAS